MTTGTAATETAVLEVSGVQWATEKAVVEAVLGRRPGCSRSRPTRSPRPRPSPTTRPAPRSRSWPGGSATAATTARASRCPGHVCDPLLEAPPRRPPGHAGARRARRPRRAAARAGTTPAAEMSPHEMMGHGGHGGMSMAAMVADMRNRFLVAAVLSVPVLLWSPIGREVLGFDGAGAVRAARRRVLADPQPAGDLLLGVDLLRRRLPGAAGPHAGHDGAGRRRGRRRLAATRWWSP